MSAFAPYVHPKFIPDQNTKLFRLADNPSIWKGQSNQSPYYGARFPHLCARAPRLCRNVVHVPQTPALASTIRHLSFFRIGARPHRLDACCGREFPSLALKLARILLTMRPFWANGVRQMD